MSDKSKLILPISVAFLLESVLAESPDEFTIDDHVKKELSAVGINVEFGRTIWKASGALGFFMDVSKKVIIFSSNTHYAMEDELKTAVSKACIYPYSFKNYYTTVTDRANAIGIAPTTPSELDSPIYFYNVPTTGTPDESIKNYLRDSKLFYKNLFIRGTGDSSGSEQSGAGEASVIAGRIWTHQHVMSFWNTKETVHTKFEELFKFIHSLGGDKHKTIYEFLDFKKFFTYEDLLDDSNETPTVSKEEMLDLLKKQHLDPKSKEKLTGDEYKDSHMKKHARGYDYAAFANAAGGLDESHSLAESPDVVHAEDGKQIAHWGDVDGLPFYIFEHSTVLSARKSHIRMLRDLKKVFSTENWEHVLPARLADFDLAATSIHDLKKDYNGKLGKYLDILGEFWDGDRLALGICGRVWTNKKIISFWNNMDDEVLRQWNRVGGMFKTFSHELGNINDYKIDWIEREARADFLSHKWPALTSASSIDDVKFDKKMSSDEHRELLKKIHTMSPEDKKKALRAIGSENKKADELADKLHMTTAELNHLLNVSENKIIWKLKDLI